MREDNEIENIYALSWIRIRDPMNMELGFTITTFGNRHFHEATALVN
jgi:hypothetical protein